MHQRNPVFYRDDLRCDRHGNLGRCLSAKVQPHRAVQAPDLCRRQVEQRQPLLTRRGVAARTERTNVEGGRLQRLQEHHVVQLGVVRQRHHRAVRIQLQLQHKVVWHLLAEGGATHVPSEVVFLARVAADHLEVQRQCHLCQHPRQLTGANDQQPPAWAEQCAQPGTVELELLTSRSGFHLHLAGVEIQHARHQAMPRCEAQNVIDPVGREQGLLHQAQVAAAGKAEACGLFLGDAVSDQRRPCDALAGTNTFNQVVFDAATRN